MLRTSPMVPGGAWEMNALLALHVPWRRPLVTVPEVSSSGVAVLRLVAVGRVAWGNGWPPVENAEGAIFGCGRPTDSAPAALEILRPRTDENRQGLAERPGMNADLY